MAVMMACRHRGHCCCCCWLDWPRRGCFHCRSTCSPRPAAQLKLSMHWRWQEPLTAPCTRTQGDLHSQSVHHFTCSNYLSRSYITNCWGHFTNLPTTSSVIPKHWSWVEFFRLFRVWFFRRKMIHGWKRWWINTWLFLRFHFNSSTAWVALAWLGSFLKVPSKLKNTFLQRCTIQYM